VRYVRFDAVCRHHDADGGDSSHFAPGIRSGFRLVV
jgi:hypothetical protein